MTSTFGSCVYLTVGTGWGEEGIAVRVGRLEENKLNGLYLIFLLQNIMVETPYEITHAAASDIVSVHVLFYVYV